MWPGPGPDLSGGPGTVPGVGTDSDAHCHLDSHGQLAARAPGLRLARATVHSGWHCGRLTGSARPGSGPGASACPVRNRAGAAAVAAAAGTQSA